MSSNERVYEGLPIQVIGARRRWIEVLDLGISTGEGQRASVPLSPKVRRPSAFVTLP